MYVKRLLLSMIVALSFVGAAQARNLLDTMRADPNLSTFVGLIDKAGATAQFTGAEPLTVLAPTNAAFDAVGASQMRAIEEPQRLRSFILGHVIPGARVWGGGGTEHTTANIRTIAGTNIEVEMTGGGAATINNNVRLVSSNIRADNGIIHTIAMPIGAR